MYIYLIQPDTYINTDIYKIGQTQRSLKERLKEYKKNILLCYWKIKNPLKMEKTIKAVFALKFKKFSEGNEYFRGDPEDMTLIINMIISKNKEYMPEDEPELQTQCLSVMSDSFMEIEKENGFNNTFT
jgi:hypothetical protein